MTKEEINKKVFELNNDEEILNFINARISELESVSEEVTVGQNYCNSFRNYISKKTHFKAAYNFGEKECPDLVYDDIRPYFDLIKSIKESNWYNLQTLLTTIFFTIRNYLPPSIDIEERMMLYYSKIGGALSIGDIKEKNVGFCSEISGLSHNMFKFLGIDSECVFGLKDKEPHAYNIIYPRGYDNEPMVLYDPTKFISFEKEGDKISFGFFKPLNKLDYDEFLSGKPLRIDLGETEENYRKIGALSGCIDGYSLIDESVTYTYGNSDSKEYE